MVSPTISVIVPVYNKEDYIAQMIYSVKTQSFCDYECMLIDDGSTDASGLVCDQTVANEPEYILVHTRNGGVSRARNTALKLVRGDYITFVDSDDEIPKNYLLQIANDLIVSQADMVVSGFQFSIRVSGEKRDACYPFENRRYTMQEVLPTFAEVQADCGLFGWCWAKTFRRDLIEDCKFDESLTLCEDFDFYLKVYPRIKTIYFNNTNIYYYHSERSNFSSLRASEIDYLAQVKVNVRYKQFLESQGGWSGSNERIVMEAIQRFLFLSVFHSPLEHFDKRFDRAVLLLDRAGIRITGKIGFRRYVLSCIEARHRNAAKAAVCAYRVARRIARRCMSIEH